MNDHDIQARRAGNEPPRLLDLAREAIRARHYSHRTEETYLQWMKRFILFSGKRHPRELGAAAVTAFLNDLATRCNVAAATQNQALAALLFLYKEVIAEPLPWLDEVVHAKRPVRRPSVLTSHEAHRLLANLHGTKWLMASLLYGAGLRLRECLNLRVKDVDFGYRQIVVRDGKGARTGSRCCRRHSSSRCAAICCASNGCTSETWKRATARSNCRSQLRANIRVRPVIGVSG